MQRMFREESDFIFLGIIDTIKKIVLEMKLCFWEKIFKQFKIFLLLFYLIFVEIIDKQKFCKIFLKN